VILQALKEYYDRKTRDGGTELAPAGFEPKEIPFVVVLDQNGNFMDLEDTRDGDGKKKTGQIRIVPQGVKRSGKNSWQTAYLLWDHIGYVFGHAEDDPERAQKQHESFIGRIRQAFPEPDADAGVSAVLTFLERADFQPVYQHPYWEDLQKSKGNISFRLLNDVDLVCQRPAVRAVVEHAEIIDAVQQRCLISGENEVIERLHPSIKGVWGAQMAGADIVSFNRSAFNSYGKTQGFNAPIGQKTAFAYTSALNHLLRKGSRQRLQVGDASTVFWAEKEHPLEDDFLALFEADRDDPDRNINAVRALYRAPETGTGHFSDEDTRFYVLGLAPNAARIAVRFWRHSTVGELARNIRQHFDDLDIIHGPRDPEFLSLSRLLESTALQAKRDNIPPNLAGDVIRAILSGTPYPWTLLTAAIRRIRAEQRLTYPRAALIKAVLVRKYRQNLQEVDVSLDLANTNIGYRLGRLFAVLERAQEAANPGINATIRERYYGAASATPVTAFPQLLKLKNHHIAKLENRGQAVNLEKLLGEIMDGIDDFPPHLAMENQGRFAIGYYHQRQEFFKPSNHSQEDQHE